MTDHSPKDIALSQKSTTGLAFRKSYPIAASQKHVMGEQASRSFSISLMKILPSTPQ